MSRIETSVITLINNYDLADGDAIFDYMISLRNKYSLQLNWDALEGLFDAVVSIEQSNDNINWHPVTTADFATLTEVPLALTLETITGSDSINDSFGHPGKYLRARITANNCTGGVLTGLLNVR